MKSKSLLVLVVGIVTGASGCGGGSLSLPPVCLVNGCRYPVPSINSLNPSGAVAGGPGLTLNVQGENFLPGSVVRWNGSDRPTTAMPYLNAIAQIPASDIAATGNAEITVFTPAPGGGASNILTFTIAAHGVYPSSVAVHPAGTFAYVTTSGSDNVSTYAINTDGTLTFKTTIAAGSHPVSIAVHSSGKFAYVANFGSGDVSSDVTTYVINTDGTLTFKGTIATGIGPASVVVDPSGRFAYVANENADNISMYTIDATTGALTSAGTIAAGAAPISVAVDPSGKFAYVANFGAGSVYDSFPGSVSMYTIDTTTGALMPNGEIPDDASESVTVDPSGRFAYVGKLGGVGSMYSIDTTTGKLTSLGAVDGGGGVLAVHPSGKFVYAAGGPAFSPGVVSVYTLNATTGVLASNGTAPTELYPIAIAIAPSGKFAYVANYNSHSISMYTIDAVTGTLTRIGTIGT